jgi:hypothetical protein
MSLNAVISHLHTGTYTVTRPGTPSYGANGIAVDAAGSTFSIVAQIQPVTARMLTTTEFSQFTSEDCVIRTATELRATAGSPDTIDYLSATWAVRMCARWQGCGVVFYRAIISRQART